MTEDRIIRALRAIVREFFPQLTFLGLFEYRVVSQNAAGEVSLQVVEKRAGLDDLPRVSARPGTAGTSSTLAPGSTVLVGFEQGDSGRPFIAHCAASNAPGHVPLKTIVDAVRIELGASPTRGAARYHDEVDVGALRITTTALLGSTAFQLQHVLGGVPQGVPLTIQLGVDAVQDLALVGAIATASDKTVIE